VASGAILRTLVRIFCKIFCTSGGNCEMYSSIDHYSQCCQCSLCYNRYIEKKQISQFAELKSALESQIAKQNQRLEDPRADKELIEQEITDYKEVSQLYEEILQEFYIIIQQVDKQVVVDYDPTDSITALDYIIEKINHYRKKGWPFELINEFLEIVYLAISNEKKSLIKDTIWYRGYSKHGIEVLFMRYEKIRSDEYSGHFFYEAELGSTYFAYEMRLIKNSLRAGADLTELLTDSQPFRTLLNKRIGKAVIGKRQGGIDYYSSGHTFNAAQVNAFLTGPDSLLLKRFSEEMQVLQQYPPEAVSGLLMILNKYWDEIAALPNPLSVLYAYVDLLSRLDHQQRSQQNNYDSDANTVTKLEKLISALTGNLQELDGVFSMLQELAAVTPVHNLVLGKLEKIYYSCRHETKDEAGAFKTQFEILVELVADYPIDLVLLLLNKLQPAEVLAYERDKLLEILKGVLDYLKRTEMMEILFASTIRKSDILYLLSQDGRKQITLDNLKALAAALHSIFLYAEKLEGKVRKDFIGECLVFVAVNEVNMLDAMKELLDLSLLDEIHALTKNVFTLAAFSADVNKTFYSLKNSRRLIRFANKLDLMKRLDLATVFMKVPGTITFLAYVLPKLDEAKTMELIDYLQHKTSGERIYVLAAVWISHLQEIRNYGDVGQALARIAESIQNLDSVAIKELPGLLKDIENQGLLSIDSVWSMSLIFKQLALTPGKRLWHDVMAKQISALRKYALNLAGVESSKQNTIDVIEGLFENKDNQDYQYFWMAMLIAYTLRLDVKEWESFRAVFFQYLGGLKNIYTKEDSLNLLLDLFADPNLASVQKGELIVSILQAQLPLQDLKMVVQKIKTLILSPDFNSEMLSRLLSALAEPEEFVQMADHFFVESLSEALELERDHPETEEQMLQFIKKFDYDLRPVINLLSRYKKQANGRLKKFVEIVKAELQGKLGQLRQPNSELPLLPSQRKAWEELQLQELQEVPFSKSGKEVAKLLVNKTLNIAIDQHLLLPTDHPYHPVSRQLAVAYEEALGGNIEKIRQLRQAIAASYSKKSLDPFIADLAAGQEMYQFLGIFSKMLGIIENLVSIYLVNPERVARGKTAKLGNGEIAITALLSSLAEQASALGFELLQNDIQELSDIYGQLEQVGLVEHAIIEETQEFADIILMGELNGVNCQSTDIDDDQHERIDDMLVAYYRHLIVVRIPSEDKSYSLNLVINLTREVENPSQLVLLVEPFYPDKKYHGVFDEVLKNFIRSKAQKLNAKVLYKKARAVLVVLPERGYYDGSGVSPAGKLASGYIDA
jgi:hypothetical protein